jgi:Putative metal-binding motif
VRAVRSAHRTRSALPYDVEVSPLTRPLALLVLCFAAGCAEEIPGNGGGGSTGPTDNDDDGFRSDEDCDDGNPLINPGVTEVCDEVDNNCDGQVDEGVERAYYADLDDDGYGDPDNPVYACDWPEGAVLSGTDCDDSNADVSPSGDEVCDGLDNDCVGGVDDGVGTLWYVDDDGDGYGDPDQTTLACEAPADTVAGTGDCDDSNVDVHAGASEACNGWDDDCDGEVDEFGASGETLWYEDRDRDGYGDAALDAWGCDAYDGTVADSTDCDDDDAAVNPGAAEACNGWDDDCDGDTDEYGAEGETLWYEDSDSDGYGDPAFDAWGCEMYSGTVVDATDCDDSDALINPGATETCNGLDDDCDGSSDEAGAVGEIAWTSDSDGDGYGEAGGATTTACAAPSGTVVDATDCDDSDALVNPAATETCNGVDDDCDGSSDEAGSVGELAWANDYDGDGYGDSSAVVAVACGAPSTGLVVASDCDDSDATVHPGATEICDGADDNCDGTEAGAVSFETATNTLNFSASFAAGSALAPATITLRGDGVLWVCDGTYYVNLSLSGSSQQVVGWNGSGATIFDGAGGRTLSATADVDLLGLRLQNGSTSAAGGNLWLQANTATLSDVVLADGTATDGGNLACESCSLSLEDCSVEGGTASGDGGGIWASGADLDVVDSLVFDNHAGRGGGTFSTSSTSDWEECLVSGNSASDRGGGAVVDGGSIHLISSEVSENSADLGGGVATDGSTLYMTHARIIDNGATTYGGGTYQQGSSELACRADPSAPDGVYGNTAPLGGGAYLVETGGAVTSSSCDWDGTGDNDLWDVVTHLGSTYSFGDDADFLCVAGSCD